MDEFVVDFKLNKEFETPVAASFSIEGAGAATLFLSFLLDFTPGVIIGLLLVISGVFILLLDLGNPFRFWRAINRLKTAWISRGTIFISGMFTVGLLYAFFPNVNYPGYHATIGVSLCVFSVMTMLYTGFLVSSMTAIPFWNTPLVPILFICHATVSGLSVLLFATQLGGYDFDRIARIMGIEICLLVFCLLLVTVYIIKMSKATSCSIESVKRLMKGENRNFLFYGAILSGILIPLLIYFIVYYNMKDAQVVIEACLLIAMVLRLTGDFYFRRVILKVGIYKPILELSS